MTITINNKLWVVPTGIDTIADVAEANRIPSKGTAIAVNNRIVRQPQWDSTPVRDGDSLMVISAAFGG